MRMRGGMARSGWRWRACPGLSEAESASHSYWLRGGGSRELGGRWLVDGEIYILSSEVHFSNWLTKEGGEAAFYDR